MIFDGPTLCRMAAKGHFRLIQEDPHLVLAFLLPQVEDTVETL